MAEIITAIVVKNGCPDFGNFLEEFMLQLEPPEGEGYQLWGTTTEGEPWSPVFITIDELCRWCEKNDTIYADTKATKEEWKKNITIGYCSCKIRNIVEKGHM